MYPIHNEASNSVSSADLPLVVWLNTITDPPYQTEKNKFSSQPSENPSISGRIEPPVSRSGMSWIIGVSVYIEWEITP